ncbi:hypothetical protein BBO99_00007010 [Phytophthora kernoviae]|uniref:START domain-containing protein n=2 Tax=Phytophthora kernoviae TaxID=325452 RepID=A0A3R7HCQ4_9STRA|nr:hypothetical protein G195_007923 [Phytophthora kernoviae 00238/432]KAG2512928.1 hypothetical protein JM16_006635 [Phytophthora kernoviae]KAG2516745.1 hypothetical protein JM18_006479 [Phytophthora kernoviae]RLN45852.1 hypothetical protein BBI17_007023 [Phytophthora kernoviae]RLN77106.1 hypothetical protein BBO99_00007010 [Phytophthora kernoviae]
MKPSSDFEQEHIINQQALMIRSKWKEIAAAECDKRRRSEETNRKLKNILTHQIKVDKNLRQVLQKRSLLKGLDFVFGNEPTSRYSFAAFENNKAIMDHLEQKVAQHYLDSDSLFQSGSPPVISCSTQIKINKKLGKTAENLSTTPVDYPMEVAAEIAWKDLTNHQPCPEKWAQCMRGSQPNSKEKNWILTLQCQSYVKQVKGVQFLRKFEEPNRIVIVKADLMTLTDEGLQFRDQCWTIVTRSETNPNASIVHVCEQIFMERQESYSARREDVEYAQNVVLKNLNWKLREHSQSQRIKYCC